MPKVKLAQAAFYPLGSRVINPSGTIIDVSDEDEATLRELGVLADSVEVEEVLEPVQVSELEPVSEPAPDWRSTYPALPKKTAPVSEWKEYARQNDIKLTGLTRRNEIMGFITKTVNAGD